MKSYPISIKPFGQHALLVEWPNKVDEPILNDILEFVDAFKAVDIPNWEMSVAYNSLTLVNCKEVIGFEDIKNKVLEIYAKPASSKPKRERYLWRLPVCYDLFFGIDIKEVAVALKLTVEELISIHTSHQYMVYGIGFLPGFMYLGGLPKNIEVPRRAEPRLAVEKGAVGLAGKQTGIYPQDSPGGWNIIGNCPIPIFNPKLKEPCFVKVGDKIQFYGISRAEHELRKIEGEVGIFKPEKTILHA